METERQKLLRAALGRRIDSLLCEIQIIDLLLSGGGEFNIFPELEIHKIIKKVADRVHDHGWAILCNSVEVTDGEIDKNGIQLKKVTVGIKERPDAN